MEDFRNIFDVIIELTIEIGTDNYFRSYCCDVNRSLRLILFLDYSIDISFCIIISAAYQETVVSTKMLLNDKINSKTVS